MGLNWGIADFLEVLFIHPGYVHVFCLNWGLGDYIALIITSGKLCFLAFMQWAPVRLVNILFFLE